MKKTVLYPSFIPKKRCKTIDNINSICNNKSRQKKNKEEEKLIIKLCLMIMRKMCYRVDFFNDRDKRILFMLFFGTITK